jgi:hypothetical protein
MRTVLRAAAPVTVSLAVAASVLAPVPALAAPVVEPDGWTPTTTLSGTSDQARGARVAADATGTVTAVWVARDTTSSSTSSSRVVASTHVPGGGWSAPVDVSSRAAEVSAPAIVSAPGGRATVVWAQGETTSSVVLASSRSATGTWSAPVALSSSLTAVASAFRVEADADANGTTTASWVDQGVVEAATRVVDGAWSSPVDVSPADQYVYRADLDVSSGGASAVTWRSHDRDVPPMPAPADQVGVATGSAGGAWAEPVEVTSTDDVGDPVVAVAPDGTTTVAWPDRTVPGGSLVSARRPAGGTWSAPETITTGAIEQASLVALPGGRVTAAWVQTVAAGSYVAHADRANGAWGGPTSFYPGFGASDVSLVVDATGSTAATWVNRDAAGGPFVQVARRPAGQGWVAVDDLTGTLTDRQLPSPEPQVAWGGAGDLIAVWSRINGVDNVVQTRTWDGLPPVIDTIAAPVRAKTHRPVTFSVTASDAWPPVSVAWNFSESIAVPGSSAEHTYSRPGSYTTKVTVTDAAGNETVRFVTTSVSWSRPGLQVRTNRRAIHRVGSSRSPRKVRARITLTQGAKVTVQVKRVGRPKVVTRVTKRLAAGDRTMRLTSRIGGRSLAPGRYSLVVRAKNGHGTSRAVKVPLRIKR